MKLFLTADLHDNHFGLELIPLKLVKLDVVDCASGSPSNEVYRDSNV
jgi:hypothetical protein